ncbi:hypothetical protein tinsulaeT_15430 [Thalassotalea insulae]|uniref:LamG-like jellyroll fold domain-containing protein n=1 Tax=Thalassotalea insulae TaxID=2056778 RepID=A0ABQ6GQG8_9GAMM|nr:Ig-like domain-containing protein [Thalassotalea insulae]GLX78203.1 hypothetical protein tinsulaeT_15430 [Thalassotalea insulae]
MLHHFLQLKNISILIVIFSLISCGGSENSNTTTSVNQEFSESPITEESTPQIFVINHMPNTSQSDVPVDANITIALSDVISSDLNANDIELYRDNEKVAGKIMVENESITFIPKTMLSYSSDYKFSLNPTGENKKNIAPYSFHFSTQASNEQAKRSFHPIVTRYGQTEITLFPNENITANTLVKASFGIPFPRGYITNITQFRLLDESGNEIPVATRQLLPWHETSVHYESIRSIIVQIKTSFNLDEYQQLAPKTIILEWGRRRSTVDRELTPVEDSWLLVNDQEYPASEQIYEPAVYAVFSPEWYGNSVIKTRLLPVGSHPDLSAYDNAFQLFGDTAINRVDPRVLDDNLIPHRNSYAAWLFDRAMAIYQLAFKTGEYKYLRAAHRASQFYLKHINDNGYFSLKSSNDMKYSYGESLVTNYILQGTSEIPETFNKLNLAWDSFHTEYTLNSNFWTERHAAVQLLGYVTSYEMTGEQAYLTKATNTFLALKNMQENPVDGAPKTGGLMHTAESHGEGGEHYIASPWMSAYLIDAIERYYIHSEDLTSLDFIIKMADFFKTEGVSLYEWKGWQGKDSYYVPHYIAGIDLTAQQQGNDGSLDLEHAPDVIKTFAAAYFASCALTQCDSNYLTVIAKLYNSVITYSFPYWIRTSAPDAGLSSYRLAPPRKFNWWFKGTANIDFLIEPETSLPSYKDSAPLLTLTQQHNATYFSPGESITFTFKLKNVGTITAKNVVVFSNVLKSSPNGLLKISEVDQSGYNRYDAAVWKIPSLAPGETLEELSFTVDVTDFPVLPTTDRPIGNILAFATLYFCAENDDEDTCRIWQSNWDTGVQTYKTQSNWQIIKPTPPVSPPTINIINPMPEQAISDLVEINAEISDSDDVALAEFWLNNEKLATFSEAPYSHTMQSNALADKAHKLTVKAWDKFGSYNEKSVSFTALTPDRVAPVVTINSPESNETFCDDVSVQYQVQDNYSVSHCVLELDNEQVKLDNCQPYQINKAIPIFKSLAYLPFDLETNTIVSRDGSHLIGTAKDVIFTNDPLHSAISFNGQSSEINFDTTQIPITNDLTIAFWIKPDNGTGMLMSQSWDYIGNEQGWAIYLGPNFHRNNNELSISWSSGDNTHNANDTNIVQTPANSINLNVWQHIVIRKHDKTVAIFINGEEVISKQIAQQEISWPFNSDKILSIGKPMNHPDFYNRRYQGSLDDVIIWDTALSTNEISTIYQPEDINLTKELTIYGYDKAGNVGQSSATFTVKSCN